jgi:Zn-dependent protease with chaperone function
MSSPNLLSLIDPASLKDPKEKTAFGWLVFFSIIVWLLLTLWVISTLGIALIFIGLFALGRYIAQLFALAYIKTNAIEVSALQFPEIHSIAADFSARLGKTTPTVYVMQHNVWNALAMKIAGKRIVVLLSGAVDSLLLKGSMTQLAWVVGHELGHHYAGHLNFWRSLTAHFGSWFIWVGLWYKRRCEFTSDRYGLACANNLEESLRALCNMSAGAQLAQKVDIQQALEQWERYRSEFFVKYRSLYSTHPHILCRIKELIMASPEMGLARLDRSVSEQKIQLTTV